MEGNEQLKVYDCAVENYKNGLNCAESVYNALLRAGALDMPKESVAMCTGLGGGIGMSGQTCGALLAAVLANGAVYGRRDPWSVAQEVRGKELSETFYRRYNAMVHAFAKAHQGVTCAEICAPFDDWHSKERRKHCLKLIADTAVMAHTFLQMAQEEAFRLPYGPNMALMK